MKIKALTITGAAIIIIFCLGAVSGHQESSTGEYGRSNTEVPTKVVGGNIVDIEPHDPHREERRRQSLGLGTPIAYSAGHK
jgi:hypothetical protein